MNSSSANKFILAKDPWATGLENWTYRQPINISNTADNLTNYQVRIDLNSSNVGSNFNWTRNGSDLRFTNSSDSLLNFWVENWSSTYNASIIWVNVSYLQNNTNTTIYMYYGNPSASNISNGTKTFIFFDHFEGTTLDTNKWNYPYGSTGTSISGSIVSMIDRFMTSGGSIQTNNAVYPNNAALRSKSLVTDFNRVDIFMKMYGAGEISYSSSGGTNGKYVVGSNQNILGVSANVWFIQEERRTTNISYAVNDANIVSFPSASITDNKTIYFYCGWGANAYYQQVDWVLVRSYTSPEPSFTFGSEENYTSVKNVTDMPYALTTNAGGEFIIVKDSVVYNLTASGDINDNQWHHLAATYDGSEAKLYRDGSLATSSSQFSGSLPVVSGDLWIGCNYSSTNSGNFNGTIGKIRIYNRILSGTEIQMRYLRMCDS